MRKKNYKGRCEKRQLRKCKAIAKTYDPVQYAYADILDKNPNVSEILCNIEWDGEAGEYMTDFLCVLASGERMVRECVYRKLLAKPMTMKLLDMSRTYWLRHGVSDWGIVVDAAEE